MFGRLTPVVKNLLIINIVLYLLTALAASNFGLDLLRLFGLYYIFSEYFKPFQFLTYMFMHSGFGHIFGNMFGLFIFGPLLESFWGPKKFLIFYLVTGIGAAVLFSAIDFIEMRPMEQDRDAYIEAPSPERFNAFVVEHAEDVYGNSELYDFIDKFSDNPASSSYINESKGIVMALYEREANIPLVGASGAIFGILMAFALLFPNTELFLLFFPFPIKAKYFVLFYGLYEVYALVERTPGDNVAHLAHLGGMLFAFILVKVWQKDRNNFY